LLVTSDGTMLVTEFGEGGSKTRWKWGKISTTYFFRSRPYPPPDQIRDRGLREGGLLGRLALRSRGGLPATEEARIPPSLRGRARFGVKRRGAKRPGAAYPKARSEASGNKIAKPPARERSLTRSESENW